MTARFAGGNEATNSTSIAAAAVPPDLIQPNAFTVCARARVFVWGRWSKQPRVDGKNGVVALLDKEVSIKLWATFWMFLELMALVFVGVGLIYTVRRRLRLYCRRPLAVEYHERGVHYAVRAEHCARCDLCAWYEVCFPLSKYYRSLSLPVYTALRNVVFSFMVIRWRTGTLWMPSSGPCRRSSRWATARPRRRLPRGAGSASCTSLPPSLLE